MATTWAAAVKTCPPLASITTSTLPFFREFRHYYSQLLEKRNDVADYHEQRDAANGSYFDFDGVEHEPYKPKGLPPPSALPTDISNFTVKDDKQKSKPPAQRSLCKILYHEEWCKLYQENQDADRAARDAGSVYIDGNASRYLSTCAEHSGAWLNTLPASLKMQSNIWLVAFQRRFGLFVSEADTYYDALETEGRCVSETERLGDPLYGGGGHQSAHKHPSSSRGATPRPPPPTASCTRATRAWARRTIPSIARLTPRT